jgi:hypothetical protein
MADTKLIGWWQWLPFQPWRIVAVVESAPDVPAVLPRNAAVLVGTRQHPKWIAFDCPCRTGHRILITLDERHKPHWRLMRTARLTLHPSVDSQTNARRCHYFIRNGRTLWAYDEVKS